MRLIDRTRRSGKPFIVYRRHSSWNDIAAVQIPVVFDEREFFGLASMANIRRTLTVFVYGHVSLSYDNVRYVVYTQAVSIYNPTSLLLVFPGVHRPQQHAVSSPPDVVQFRVCVCVLKRYDSVRKMNPTLCPHTHFSSTLIAFLFFYF